MKPLTHFSLFTGIGGIDIAAEAAGFETICQCEWADYPNAVLQKNWPHTSRFQDIAEVTKEAFIEKTGQETITLISGGFPCQPFSPIGRRKGFEDKRYLWPEMLRVIRELRPRWVLGENVAGFINMGLDKTVADLERENYTVRVFVLPAVAVGAWHERKRTFIIGLSLSDSPCRGQGQHRKNAEHTADCKGALPENKPKRESMGGTFVMDGLPHDTGIYRKRPVKSRLGGMADGLPPQVDGRTLWDREPGETPRLVETYADNLNHRLKCLGNAVVPAQVYPILRYIADIELGRCREWCVFSEKGGAER